jgi:hypothetical protein
MSAHLKNFFSALNSEEKLFANSLVNDNLGIGLRSAINELDWYYYNYAKESSPTAEQQEQFYILQLGAIRLIQIALDARDSFDVPVVMFRRRPEITLPTLKIVSAFGVIDHGRRVAQTVAQNLAHIEQIAENEYVITLPERIIDDEYYDKSVAQHYTNESRRTFSQIKSTETWKKLEKDVDEKLFQLVYPFETHYIGYDAAPILDEYFFGLAYHEIQLHDGFDTFHYQTLFGGIRFQYYILALTFVMSFNFRHERFAEALTRKNLSIRLENILTISSDKADFLESLKDAVNYFGSSFENFSEIDIETAEKIFQVLSISRRSTSLIAAPGSPLPLLVQSSDEGFIRCLTGAHSEPVRFLLESLRFHFPGDYDKNQNARERSMQSAIKRVLNGTFSDLEYRENVKLRRNGSVITDVDLVVLEKSTGAILLLQLKHQDMYGYNLHAKRNRGDRLKEQALNWLNTIDDWRRGLSERELRDTFRISKDMHDLQSYCLVLTRHFSHPLKDVVKGQSNYHSNWIQFVNAVELCKQGNKKSVTEVLKSLRDIYASGFAPEHMDEPPTRWQLKNLIFSTKQVGASSS